MKMIQLLDCTLRDGAHLNGGRFGEKMIRRTIRSLTDAKLDIVEVGFFVNEDRGPDATYFHSIEDVRRVLPRKKGNVQYSLMADFVDVDGIEPWDGTIDIFRLSFKRHRLDWALDAARTLMDKGYKVFINPVNCSVYTDEEYLSVIRRVNELHPYGFSMVDTFGVLRKQDLSRLYYLLEGNLLPDITIGLHLHENLGLAYSLAQHFLEIRSPRRKIVIDCSLLGMGRIPGNLCTEQIMEHMNLNYGTDYATEPALDAIDDDIAPIKREIPWGYSIPYALSGKFGLHRTYAEYLMGKNRLKAKDIQRILSMVDREHIEMFDEAYIEGLYRQYRNVSMDDSAAIDTITREISGKRVVVICPGSSIATHIEQIRAVIDGGNTCVISVNFIPDFCKPDYMFCANAKRLRNFDPAAGVRGIFTSNLRELVTDPGSLMVSFNSCAYFGDKFCEDSTLLLLKLLRSCDCDAVWIAGFDGFGGQSNYYDRNYSRESGTFIDKHTVMHLLGSALKDLKLHFITPSIYCTSDGK